MRQPCALLRAVQPTLGLLCQRQERQRVLLVSRISAPCSGQLIQRIRANDFEHTKPQLNLSRFFRFIATSNAARATRSISRDV